VSVDEYDPEYGGGKYTPEGEVKIPPELAPLEEVPIDEINNWPDDIFNKRLSSEMGNDIKPDFGTDSGSGRTSDYGGELAGGDGVDLNAGTDVSVDINQVADTGNVGEDLNDIGYERLEPILDNFQGDRWSDLSLDEQKQSMIDLADYVASDTGNTNPPEIIFSDDMPDGTYGGYNPGTNTMEINVNMLDDSLEAADTIAHEMWHAYQEQVAKDPNNPRAADYQEGFDNYISPEYDFEGYQNQMVEAEARDYAQGFKDRLTV